MSGRRADSAEPYPTPDRGLPGPEDPRPPLPDLGRLPRAPTTRFAPSPTGFLHIGGARTALFNWLYARHHGGEFLLRIEDTDRARSTQPAIDAILTSLRWLELDWDGQEVYQSQRAERHAQVAHTMVEHGHAYRCYLTQDELEKIKRMIEKECGEESSDHKAIERLIGRL